MKDAQNEFYSSISKYYPEIFPYNPAQLQFVKESCGGLTGKRILDIGCATGELSYQLACAGAEVAGIDLNDDLLARARSEKIHPDLTFRKLDMLNLKKVFHNGEFDAVICFGNTLVHLSLPEHVRDVFKDVRSIVKTGGLFLIQILNYGYILSEKVSELPVIETENIRFSRNYIFSDDGLHIGFKTELHLKKEGKVILNETPLLALPERTLTELLVETGFNGITRFAGFKEEPFGGKHLPLVVKAVS